MKPKVVALSGRVCAGKTTLARGLEQVPGGVRLSTHDVLRRMVGSQFRQPTERQALQEIGRTLDAETGGRWVADSVAGVPSQHRIIIIDAVRHQGQLEHLRHTFLVTHIHLTAPYEVLSSRYDLVERDRSPGRTPLAYAVIAGDATETSVDALAGLADGVIDTAIHDVAETHATAAWLLSD